MLLQSYFPGVVLSQLRVWHEPTSVSAPRELARVEESGRCSGLTHLLPRCQDLPQHPPAAGKPHGHTAQIKGGHKWSWVYLWGDTGTIGEADVMQKNKGTSATVFFQSFTFYLMSSFVFWVFFGYAKGFAVWCRDFSASLTTPHQWF